MSWCREDGMDATQFLATGAWNKMPAIILSGLVGFVAGMFAWAVFGAPAVVCAALYVLPTALTLIAMVVRHFLVIPARQVPLHSV